MAASHFQRSIALPHLNWKSRANCAPPLGTQKTMWTSRFEQRTRVVLEIQIPIVALISHNRTGYETPRATIHISGAPFESSRRSVERPFLKTCLGPSGDDVVTKSTWFFLDGCILTRNMVCLSRMHSDTAPTLANHSVTPPVSEYQHQQQNFPHLRHRHTMSGGALFRSNDQPSSASRWRTVGRDSSSRDAAGHSTTTSASSSNFGFGSGAVGAGAASHELPYTYSASDRCLCRNDVYTINNKNQQHLPNENSSRGGTGEKRCTQHTDLDQRR